MDRARRWTIGFVCELVWRSTVGFRSKSFRFAKGGGRRIIGLKRTGKSCRLRWVNYLHPGLKRGKMTPHEERLVLELHSKWGNRWSRIARKLPGRTDNEIKNYWRTHMRKKAQEIKKTTTNNTSTSSTLSSKGKSPIMKTIPAVVEAKEGRSFYDTGGFDSGGGGSVTGKAEDFRSMDEIWRDIELCEDNCVKPIFDAFSEGESYFSCQTIASPPPLWNVSLWANEDPFYSFYNQDSSSMLTG